MTDTAAQISKLLGASQIVLVNFTSGNQSQHREDSTSSTKVIATVQVEANARLIDVETDAILAQPSCTFKQDKFVRPGSVHWIDGVGTIADGCSSYAGWKDLLVAVNTGNFPKTFQIDYHGKCITTMLHSESAATYVW